MLNKKTVDDINVKGKKVLVRCDFNVPLQDGKITDENRLVAALPTIKKLIADGGKIILCSHLGKPKGEPKPELSLAPVAVRLSELLGQEVKFAADPEVVGPNAKAAVEAMNDGDVILLENTRYRAEETKNGDEFSKELASLCDVFVNDAFGTAHRAHCSNVGVTKYVCTQNIPPVFNSMLIVIAHTTRAQFFRNNSICFGHSCRIQYPLLNDVKEGFSGFGFDDIFDDHSVHIGIYADTGRRTAFNLK